MAIDIEKRAHVALGAEIASGALGVKGLGGVFDHPQVMFHRNCFDRVQIAGAAVEMNDDDGLGLLID